jgi:hypothetical protein
MVASRFDDPSKQRPALSDSKLHWPPVCQAYCQLLCLRVNHLLLYRMVRHTGAYSQRQWSGLSGRNLTWNVECLQSLSSIDFTHNFSCRYAVQGCEKIALSWDIQFKFAPPRKRATAALIRLWKTWELSHTHNWISTYIGTGAGQTHTLSYSFGPLDMRGLRKMHYKFYCVEGVNLYN